MNEVTRILSAIEQGDPHAADQLLPLITGSSPVTHSTFRTEQPDCAASL